MPSPSAHSAADSLRVAYRRLWYATIVCIGAVLGLLPLVCTVAAPAWQRAMLGGLALLYLAAKSYRLHRTRRSVRQLRMERCFIGHTFDGRQLRRCLQRRGHLWTHCYTVRALRRLMARPLPNLLVTDEKRQRVQRTYRHALAGMRPPRLRAELPVGGLLLAGAGIAAGAGGAGAAWTLYVGLASALALVGAEGALALLRRQARRAFDRLTEALSEWTLARSVHDLLQGRTPASYRHTPLYRAPAWFASQAPPRPASSDGHASSRATPSSKPRPA